MAPTITFCPAAGTCDTTMLAGEACAGGDAGTVCAEATAPGFAATSPAGGVAGGGATGAATLTFPSRNPESCRVRLTLPRDCPTKLGITNACGSAAPVNSKLILGAAILGTGGDEAIHSVLDLMYAKAPYTVMQRAVHIHPTVSELLPTILGELKPVASATASVTQVNG